MKIATRTKRRFVSEDLVIDSWEKIEPLFKNLLEKEIYSIEELENWIANCSELNAVLGEDLAWRYIKMNIDTTDKNLAKNFHFWIKEISSKTESYFHKINIKLIEDPFLKDLNQEKYRIYLRTLKNNIKLFREENIPLFTEMGSKEQEHGIISGKMSVKFNGKEITMQKAEELLKDTNRDTREIVYNKISKRRLQDKKSFDNLFDKLIILRQQIARNAGFKNYRDYMFSSLGRFDYTPQDCSNFHDAISQEIVPIITSLEKKRKEKLGHQTYKPWDAEVNTDGLASLKPFDGGKELTDKSITCLKQLKPYFGECLSTMQEMKHLDLESKKGKAPGQFCYALNEIGIPFIYMNAVGSQIDLTMMMHEGGHAIHSFLTGDLELTYFKDTPAEVAELASMSMELLSMDHWDLFYRNKKDLKRAKIKQLERVIYILPKLAAVDKFQHWIYTNKHTAKEREEKWLKIEYEFGNQVINYDNQQDNQANFWQSIHHIFDNPFYVIEYAIAQLGAISIWKSYKETGEKALENYINALKLGYTKSIPEIYETAGIKFDFSASYVKELADFIKEELEKLN
tara:strand:- start:267 stop:1976 length:1710 start_codon:yes stop_codon:yes gene_type:complete